LLEAATAMRIIVIGKEGQVARALAERAPAHGAEAVLLGRPTLDLTAPSNIEDILRKTGGDLIVNAAAFTAVDQAESEPELAELVNGLSAGAVARVAAAMNVPVIQLSTDYVFDGTAGHPYREDDAVRPLSVYGSSKLLGEQAVAEATENHVILRTAWVYSPFGRNFVKTMLRLGADRDEIRVVADQFGSPTSAFDIADGIFSICRNFVERPEDRTLRGIFHMVGTGWASWAEFATEIFSHSSRFGYLRPRIRPIATAEYPTPAKRPANSRLDCTKLAQRHGVVLPPWRASLDACIERLADEAFAKETHR
jgi:dTDP-4-dehydrorhamnose reductase